MNRLTNEQRYQIVQLYYENARNVESVLRALRNSYGDHDRPTERTIRELVTKFETTFTLLDDDPGLVITTRNAQQLGNSFSPTKILKGPKAKVTNSTTGHIVKKAKLKVTKKDKRRRNFTGYLMWAKSASEQIRKENPGITFAEVSKKAGDLWRAMKDKSEWEAKAAKAKKDYEEATKNDYEKAVPNVEANGGSPANGGTPKKRGRPPKIVANKGKGADADKNEDVENK